MSDPRDTVARMERDAKDSHLMVRASGAQIEAWKRAATLAGYRSLSAWIRDVLTRLATTSASKGSKP